MNWYLQVLKKYAVFSGRARRKEYWMFFLFNVVFSIVAIILDNIIGSTIGDAGYGVIYALYTLAMILPYLGVTVRRLHDTGRSGWWFFIILVPFIGSIWLLILMIIEGNPGENSYGPSPKETPAA